MCSRPHIYIFVQVWSESTIIKWNHKLLSICFFLTHSFEMNCLMEKQKQNNFLLFICFYVDILCKWLFYFVIETPAWHIKRYVNAILQSKPKKGVHNNCETTCKPAVSPDWNLVLSFLGLSTSSLATDWTFKLSI